MATCLAAGEYRLSCHDVVDPQLTLDSIVTLEQTVSGLGALYNMSPELAAALAAYAIAVDGNVVEGVWSIGGPLPTDLLTGSLLGTGQGISYSHNNYEGDGSIGKLLVRNTLLPVSMLTFMQAVMMPMSTMEMHILSTSPSSRLSTLLVGRKTDTPWTNSVPVSSRFRTTRSQLTHTISPASFPLLSSSPLRTTSSSTLYVSFTSLLDCDSANRCRRCQTIPKQNPVDTSTATTSRASLVSLARQAHSSGYEGRSAFQRTG